ncbi:hypothetical protein C3L33_03560, partial [Rhododendron williamsianum]
MKGGKFVAVGFSGILVVAVVIGVVAVQKSSSSGDSNKGDVLSTTSKSVSAICSPTDHQQACVDSLSAVANNQSATPKDFLQAALQYTVSAVKVALSNTTAIGNAANDPLNKMAVEDCKELLQYAIDELQASFSMVGDSSLHTMNDREAELLNWLSAVYSYQQTCVDGFTQADLQKAMSDGLLNATRLTENALSIVSSISQILAAFNIPLINTTSITTQALSNDASSRHTMKPQGDGSGQFRTIAAALAAYPKNLQGRYVIYVKAGIYDEYITVEKNQVNVFMYGDGPRKTMVTGRKSNAGGVSTFKTASFSAIGDGFIAKAMGFQNTAGPQGHQAVALRVQSDRAAFYNCRMDGYQDTLAVIMESTLGDLIHPAGWMPWQGDFALNTCFFAEYANRGPGAATARRVNWRGHKVITNRAEALSYTVVPFIQGQTWIGATGAPFFVGLKY